MPIRVESLKSHPSEASLSCLFCLPRSPKQAFHSVWIYLLIRNPLTSLIGITPSFYGLNICSFEVLIMGPRSSLWSQENMPSLSGRLFYRFPIFNRVFPFKVTRWLLYLRPLVPGWRKKGKGAYIKKAKPSWKFPVDFHLGFISQNWLLWSPYIWDSGVQRKKCDHGSRASKMFLTQIWSFAFKHCPGQNSVYRGVHHSRQNPNCPRTIK